MKSFLHLQSVKLEYPVYNMSARSLRSSLMNVAVGGKLFKDQNKPFVRALSNVTFKIGDGDRLALLGHNGSGKTTLLKVIAGIYEPTTGTVTSSGPITSTISAGAGIDYEATGLVNVRNLGRMRMVSRKTVEKNLESIVEFSGLGHYIDFPVRTYSAGMVARLMFAVTTAFDPEILVLDEWMGAGDIDFAQKAAERMQTFVDKAHLVVLATHDAGMAKKVCNKVCVLDAGSVIFFGDTDEWFSQQAA